MTILAALQTSQRIIRLAYKDAGLIQEGDDLNGEQFAEGLMRLNDLANLWQTQGLKLWTQTDQPMTLVAGQASYTLTPGGDVDLAKPLRVLQAYYLDTNSIRRPLVVLSRDDYTRLSITTQRGQVNSYFVDKQQNQLVVWVWLVPDAVAALGTVHLILQNQIGNSASLTDNDSFPVEWAMALRWGLADELATGQPASIMARCEAKAKAFRDALEDWDVEDASTMFAPDQRSMYATANFR